MEKVLCLQPIQSTTRSNEMLGGVAIPYTVFRQEISAPCDSEQGVDVNAAKRSVQSTSFHRSADCRYGFAFSRHRPAATELRVMARSQSSISR
jgi:hypothetical protein